MSTTSGMEVTEKPTEAGAAAANEAANDSALPSDAPAEPGPPTEPDETGEVPAPAPARRVRDAGMATAEYAIATLAAAGFAGLLLVVLRSDEVRGMLSSIVRQALSL